jgi:hypothetical protein
MRQPLRFVEENNRKQDNLELMLQDINQKIEELKVQYNLFFTGELRVPPEREREELAKRIRNIMYSGQKSARVNLLVQNVSSRFSTYNNMWLKRLNELETGVRIIQKKTSAFMEGEKKPRKTETRSVAVSLNSEDSFDKFFDSYEKLVSKGSKNQPNRDNIINSIKAKMITSNLIDAKVNLSVEKGKLKIKIKSSQ